MATFLCIVLVVALLILYFSWVDHHDWPDDW